MTLSRQTGHSGKTVPELEKTVGLMKKVVERVQRENEALKKSGAPSSQAKVAALEQENAKLKVVGRVAPRVVYLASLLRATTDSKCCLVLYFFFQ